MKRPIACIRPLHTSTTLPQRGKWKYILTRDAEFLLSPRHHRTHHIHSGTHHIATISPDSLIIHPGYTWDGMTCWPDSPTNLPASLAHDLGYQLGTHPKNPLTRAQIDDWLLHLLRQFHDPFATVCYTGVRALGWPLWRKDHTITIV